MWRVILSGTALALFAASADAQRIRPPRNRVPSYDAPLMVTTSIGFMRTNDVLDGSSGSRWDIGSAMQYRVSVERRVGSRIYVGATYARSSVPMQYSPLLGASPTPACSAGPETSCSASAEQSVIAASLSSGGGLGVHQVINLVVGAVRYDNFRESGTGTLLAPLAPDSDFFFALAYGLGVGLGSRVALNVVQEYGFSMHQKTGLEGNIDSFNQARVTRLSFKVGLGR